MKNDYYVNIKRAGEIINRIELLAFTNYQAKKELLKDYRKWSFPIGDTCELVNCNTNKTLLSI